MHTPYSTWSLSTCVTWFKWGWNNVLFQFLQSLQNKTETEKHHQKTSSTLREDFPWQQQMMDFVSNKPVIIKTTVVLDVNSHWLAWHRGAQPQELWLFKVFQTDWRRVEVVLLWTALTMGMLMMTVMVMMRMRMCELALHEAVETQNAGCVLFIF